MSHASLDLLRAALGELDRLLRSAAHIAKDVPHVHGGLDALVREAADLPCHHGKPLAVLAGADRLDGGVEREHVRLVRQVLHRVGDAGDLLGSLVQLPDPTRDLADLLEDVPHSVEAAIDRALARLGDLVGAQGRLQYLLGPDGRLLRGLLDLLGGDLRLLQRCCLARDDLGLLVRGRGEVLHRRGEPLGRLLHHAAGLAQGDQHAREGMRQPAHLVALPGHRRIRLRDDRRRASHPLLRRAQVAPGDLERHLRHPGQRRDEDVAQHQHHDQPGREQPERDDQHGGDVAAPRLPQPLE